MHAYASSAGIDCPPTGRRENLFEETTPQTPVYLTCIQDTSTFELLPYSLKCVATTVTASVSCGIGQATRIEIQQVESLLLSKTTTGYYNSSPSSALPPSCHGPAAVAVGSATGASALHTGLWCFQAAR
jgi:hypothetical protein